MVVDVLPLAVGIAASPFPIIPVILLLFTRRPRAASAAFLAGWVAGIVAATTAFVLLAEVVQAHDHPPQWASWTRIVLGAALAVLGVRQWLARDATDEVPGWMRSVESASPSGALRLGVLLSAANPKILLLTGAAGLAIGTEADSPAAVAAAVAAFTLVAASTVAVPVVLYAILGERILPPLATAKDWLQANNAAVMAIVVTVIGLVLAAKGIQGVR